MTAIRVLVFLSLIFIDAQVIFAASAAKNLRTQFNGSLNNSSSAPINAQPRPKIKNLDTTLKTPQIAPIQSAPIVAPSSTINVRGLSSSGFSTSPVKIQPNAPQEIKKKVFGNLQIEKNLAGSVARNGELDAQTKIAIKNKIDANKIFQKRRKETTLRWEKRKAGQQQLDEAVRLRLQIGYKKLTELEMSELKFRMRTKLANAKKRLDKVSDPKNYVAQPQQTHIMNNHRSNLRKEGKDRFPASWTEERIMHNISDIMTDPNSIHVNSNRLGYTAHGVRNGLLLQVDYLVNSEGLTEIRSGFPMNSIGRFDRLIEEDKISRLR